MINIGYYRGRRRRRRIRLHGLGSQPIIGAGAMLPSYSPAAAFDQLNTEHADIQDQVVVNTPLMPQPEVINTAFATAEHQAYAAGSPGGADGGMVGDEATQQAQFILQAEGMITPQEPSDQILSVSPTIASERTDGTFMKTWGPPLLAVAGIGLAVWILRR